MTANLTAQPREDHGKNAARALRRTGRVPGIVYGHGDETRAVSLDALELEKLLGTISVENTIIELELAGAPLRTLIREVQRHPYKTHVLHVDFLQLHAGETLKLQVPVRLSGTAYGVHTEGGVVDQVLHSLDIECLPRNIPEVVEIDVTELRVGDIVRVHDVTITDVRILNDGELAICSVHAPSVAALDEMTPVAEDGVGGDVQPELVRRARDEDETPDRA